MFDVYINDKRELLVVSSGSNQLIPVQAAKWRKRKKRIKKVSVEIALSIESKGFYLRRLTVKKHGNTHLAAIPSP
ncbi:MULTISPECIES: hypothetical protein [Bradyrhizobium]|uniref:hypothetical protein n=1 Tax=Bradyrhizobium TaxID=374 RepID=UPI001EDAD156|nr:hypothetical protein [Bradyrhizobium zhengyangense]MCG2645505.1 hypothetical protein [Bradyrhizobium zhengyangense]